MTSQAAIQQCNLESSILFMQQEHSDTLKGLHAEIQKLQKKCSELTFQLAMQSTSTTDEDVHRKRAEVLEETLTKKDKTISEFEQTIEKKDKKIVLVEQQLKAQEKKFLDDLKLKDKIVRDLTEQLDAKSNHIATLTTQLLSLKKQYMSSIEIHSKAPAPPSASHQGNARRRPRVVDPPSSGRRVPSARRLPKTPVGSGTVEYVPDPTPFLHAHDSQTDVQVDVKAHVPLPPIQSSLDEGEMPLSKSFVRSRLQLRKQKEGSSSMSKDSLAVDQVSEQSWRQPHESKSTDCT